MAITGATYSKGTLSITKAANGENTITYNTEKASSSDTASIIGAITDEDGGVYGDAVKVLNLSKVGSAKVLFNITGSSTLTSLVGSKGADNITTGGAPNVDGGAGNDVITATDDVNITTGNGNDTVVVTDGANIVITDYTKTDMIQLKGVAATLFDNSKVNAGATSVSFSGDDVTLTWTEQTDDEVADSEDSGDEGTTTPTTATLTLKNVGSNIVHITTDGESTYDQFFIDGDNYQITASNAGSSVISDKTYINASTRSSAIAIEATATNAVVKGGKGKDTLISSAAGQTLTGGAAADVFVVTADSFSKDNKTLTINDYTLNSDIIAIGEGVNINNQDYSVNGTKVTFNVSVDVEGEGDSIEGKLIVVGGAWDQKANKAKSQILFYEWDDGIGEPSDLTGVYPSLSTKVVAKLESSIGSAFDFSALDDGETTEVPVANDVAVDKNTTAVDFSAVSKITATLGGSLSSIAGSKGADTLFGEAESLTNTIPLPDSVKFVSSASEASGDYVYVERLNDNNFTVHINIGDFVDEFTIVTEKRISGSGDQFKFEITSIEWGTYHYDLAFNVGDVLPEEDYFKPTADNSDPFVNYLTGSDIYDGEYNLFADSDFISYTKAAILDGGNGNDYLYGSNVSLVGGDGKDTLRGWDKGGATLNGGAGNDTFLLTGESTPLTTTDTGDDDGEDDDADEITGGEDEDSTVDAVANAHVIADYYSGTEKYKKAERGTDVVTVVYDKYALKNTEMNGRYSITGGVFGYDTVDADGNINYDGKADEDSLYLTITGQAWNSEADKISVTTKGTTKDVAVGAFTAEEKVSTFAFKDIRGENLSITNEGITYTQIAGSKGNGDDENYTYTTEAKQNFLGYLAPDIKNVVGGGTAKLVLNTNGLATNDVELAEGTNWIDDDGAVDNEYKAAMVTAAGTKANDTLIGNGNASLTGGDGKDVFVVKNGDVVADYTGTGKAANKDSIVVGAVRNINDIKAYYTTSGEGADAVVTSKGVEVFYGTTVFGTADLTASAGQIGTSKMYTISFADTTKGYIYITVDDYGNVETIDDSSLKLTDENSSYVINYKVGDLFDAEDVSVQEIYKDYDKSEDGSFYIEGDALSSTPITFNQITTVLSTSNKGLITEKINLTTDAMTRTFGVKSADSIVSFGASDGTYLKVFKGETNAKVIDAGKNSKGITLINEAENVTSIVGGTKNDTITIGNNANDAITVTSGKGNDVIKWDGKSNVVVGTYNAKGNSLDADYTAVTVKKGKITAGDIIMLDESLADDDNQYYAVDYDGNDVLIKTYDANVKESIGEANVVATLTLVGAKDKLGVITTNQNYNINATFEADDEGNYEGMDTVSFANPHEYLLGKNDAFSVETLAAKEEDATDLPDGDGVWVINASNSTKANEVVIDTENVKTVIGGGKADTVYAVSSVTNIDGGAGNDIIFADITNSAGTKITTGNGNDVIQFSSASNVEITDYTTSDKLYFGEGSVTVAIGTGHTIGDPTFTTSGKKVSTIYGGAALQLKDGVVTFDSLTNSKKLTINYGDSVTNTKDSFALDYFSDDVTVGASDGNTIDLYGANATLVAVDAARSKAVVIKNAAVGATVKNNEDKAKSAVTFVGADFSTQSVSVNVVDQNVSGQNIYNVYLGTDTTTKIAQVSIVDGKVSGITYTDPTYDLGIKVDDEITATADALKDALNNVTWYDPTTSQNGYAGAAIFQGGKKNDTYVGGGAQDTISFGDGANLVDIGGNASIKTGGGKDTLKIALTDNYTVTDYTAGTDVFVMQEDVALNSATFTAGEEDTTKGTLVLDFVSTDTTATAAATVTLENYKTSDKVTINQYETTVKGTKSTTKVVQRYQQAFGASELVIANADGDTIATTLDSGENTTTINASAVTKAKTLVADNGVTSIIGGKAADSLIINNAGTYTGGAGNDTFAINDTITGTVTITDYNTGTDYINFGAESSFSVSDYGANYTLGASDATLTNGTVNVVLQGVVAQKSGKSTGVTSTIRIGTGATTLSDKKNIVLSASATANTFTDQTLFGATTSFNASAAKATNYTDGITFTAGTNFEELTTGAMAFNADLSASSETMTIVLGAGADNITLDDDSKANITIGAGANKATTADTINKINENVTLAVASGWSITGVTDASGKDLVDVGTTYEDKSEITTSIALTLKKGTATNTVTIADAAGFVLNATNEDSAVKATSKTVTTTKTITGFGLDNYIYSKVVTKNVPVTTADADYREAGFAELVDDDNFATASDLDNITVSTADDAAIAVDYASPITSITTSNDFTQVTTANKKNQK